MKESDLFEPIKQYLLEVVGCSNVYGEVSNCDVLGISGSLNIIVELKTSLSFKVVEQAIDRKHAGHYIYVAVPKLKSVSRLAKEILIQHRIGLLFINEESNSVEQIIPARFNRTRNTRIRERIREYHETQIGGVKSGESETDYSVTIKNVKEYLERVSRYRRYEDGWVTVDQILEQCETHYANPKPSIIATLQAKWNISWCETKVENKQRYFRYKKD